MGVGLILVEIAYHSRMYSDYSDQEINCVKELVRNTYHAVAELRGGRLFSWEGDGGAFLFPIESHENFDNCGLTAIQMLEMVPALSEDIRPSTRLDRPIVVRIACDAGTVACDPEPSNRPDDFVHKLLKFGRQVGEENRVTVTERIYRELTRPLKSRFVNWKYSSELGVELHRTPPLEAETGPPDPTDSLLRRHAVEETASQSAATTTPREQRVAAAGPPRSLVGRVGPWPMAGVALAILLLAGLFLVRALIPSAPPPAALPWNEPVRSEEWLTWRKHVHEKLSSAQAAEEALTEVLRLRPPAVRNPPAAALRHDQAIGDVLLSYDGVVAVLRNRLGIDEHFLGTGLSNPGNASDYGSASVHEYLIPNLREDDANVWTRKLKPFSVDLEKKVKDLIGEDMAQDETKQKLKQVIVSLAEGKERGAVVIRFALLNMKWYEGTLGRVERVRVFASDLTEVWDLKVKDAADRSGYTFKSGGDTFFIWVFVRGHPDEAVPATWGQVLDHLPQWLQEAQNKDLAKKPGVPARSKDGFR